MLRPGSACGAFLAVIALLTFPFLAQATDFVMNGSFEQTPIIGGGPFDGLSCASALTPCVIVPDWTTAADISILFTTGVGGNVSSYLDNGAGVTAADGANFVGGDGSCCNALGPISQTLTGLTVGQSYNLTFDQAAGQLSGNYGATTELWQVTVGGTVSNTLGPVLLSDNVTNYSNAYVVDSPDYMWRTPVISNASGGFSGWQTESYTFTANATSELLAFLAVGAPEGAPPLVLLDDVAVNDDDGSGTGGTGQSAPEPGSLALAAAGGGLLAGLLLRRQRKARA
jgi:hypothetical protein